MSFFSYFCGAREHVATEITAITGYTDERWHGLSGENVRGLSLPGKEETFSSRKLASDRARMRRMEEDGFDGASVNSVSTND